MCSRSRRPSCRARRPGSAARLWRRGVAEARGAQRKRGGTNAEVDASAIDLHAEARLLAEQVAEKLRLSARGFTRVLRLARTIADLARSPQVRRVDVAEALAFRHRVPGRSG